jgi:hypothetical protein
MPPQLRHTSATSLAQAGLRAELPAGGFVVMATTLIRAGIRTGLGACAAALAPICAPAFAEQQTTQDEHAPQIAVRGITLTAQVSGVFELDGAEGVSIVRTNFADQAFGENATQAYVMACLEQASTLTLSDALSKGARSGRIDVIAIVYELDAPSAGRSPFAPLGLFINSTELTLDSNGRPVLSKRVRYIPDPSLRDEILPER